LASSVWGRLSSWQSFLIGPPLPFLVYAESILESHTLWLIIGVALVVTALVLLL